MTDALKGLAADRAALLDICADLSASDWAAASGCPGWSVQDVVAHLGNTFQVAVDPAVLPEEGRGLPSERAQDLFVEWRRPCTAAEVLADYRAVSEKGLDMLAGLAGAEFEVPVGDLGTYPAAVLPTAYCFDHYTHIRADLFPPRGPLAGPPPPADELRLVPVLDWIEAALPQQNEAAVAALAAPVDITLTGTAARTVRVGPDGPPAAWVRSDSDAFVRWITQRAAWADLGVTAEGDERLLGVIRDLKVF
jgi:uncharacterized protein (TIGR03083 family)